MKYACNTCGSRYAIPDSRVMAAGEKGLRIRCSSCRSIMAVCFGDRGEIIHDDDVTPPQGRRSRTAGGVDAMLQALPTEVGMAAMDAGPTPAALSSSGIYRPLPGVERGVTGVHMPVAAAAMPGRDWYAAFGGRPRGPYSRAELELLADQGRVRSSTLVWRPGFESWHRVRGEGKPNDEALAWLRGIVDARKRRERVAAERASREHGIHRLHLEDFSSQLKTPPPIPTVEHKEGTSPHVLFVGRSMPSFAADRVFGAPRLGETPLHKAALLERQRRHHALSFTAGAVFVALGLVLVTYTLPALGVSPEALLEAALTLAR